MIASQLEVRRLEPHLWRDGLGVVAYLVDPGFALEGKPSLQDLLDLGAGNDGRLTAAYPGQAQTFQQGAGLGRHVERAHVAAVPVQRARAFENADRRPRQLHGPFVRTRQEHGPFRCPFLGQRRAMRNHGARKQQADDLPEIPADDRFGRIGPIGRVQPRADLPDLPPALARAGQPRSMGRCSERSPAAPEDFLPP